MFKKPGGRGGIWAMLREGGGGSERYEGGEADSPSGIPWPRPNGLFTVGGERDGSRG